MLYSAASVLNMTNHPIHHCRAHRPLPQFAWSCRPTGEDPSHAQWAPLNVIDVIWTNSVNAAALTYTAGTAFIHFVV